MDEMLVPGTAALILFYAGIVLVLYVVLRVLVRVFEAAVTGNYLVLCGILAGIAGAIAAYILIGLWLRRIEII
jgi:nitrate reductase gamma subunit